MYQSAADAYHSPNQCHRLLCDPMMMTSVHRLQCYTAWNVYNRTDGVYCTISLYCHHAVVAVYVYFGVVLDAQLHHLALVVAAPYVVVYMTYYNGIGTQSVDA